MKRENEVIPRFRTLCPFLFLSLLKPVCGRRGGQRPSSVKAQRNVMHMHSTAVTMSFISDLEIDSALLVSAHRRGP